ncbi:transposase, partial [Nocardioides massiliensis]
FRWTDPSHRKSDTSYHKGHRYLTVVADHDREGAVIWAGEGKKAATLEQFYDQLGETRFAQLQAVSMDLGAAFKKATDTKTPQARQCADPFHVVALANEASTRPAAGFGASSGTRPGRTPFWPVRNAAADHRGAVHHLPGTRPGGSNTPDGRCSRIPTR